MPNIPIVIQILKIMEDIQEIHHVIANAMKMEW